MEIKDSRAYRYAAWCREECNSNVGVYVKKQAAAWLDIAEGRNPCAFVDENALNKISKILGIMAHPDLNCPMYDGLEDYAWFLITAALCTKLRNNDGKDIRYYETVVLEIARKNFKTFNSALLWTYSIPCSAR